MSKTSTKFSLRGKCTIDFSKVGGLNDQIRLLREIIVLPLIYADLYSHFNIKAPRGVLFYGPPGTGKTLVASALANELSKAGQGKVHFFHRKGADVMDKWIGEAERKLRELFDKAAKHRPCIIFFDELDGLAPPRSQENDQVHCSVVTTLLALMDDFSNTPGVVVIGATNRVDAIDSALRRPGRFDRELYFPVPCTSARKEILQVLIQSWTHKPSSDFLTYLAELTTGCTGADLQALCSEAFLCCVKRLYPNINSGSARNKIFIDKCHLKVQECDFLTARRNITPWIHRTPSKMKKLSHCIKPLLQRQLNWILLQLQMIWPHFTTPGYKFLIDAERYLGRLLLVGTSKQGLNMHLVPALLQALEHLPIQVVDANAMVEKIILIQHNSPSVLLLSRVNDWWNLVDEVCRNALMALLEDIHPTSPILLICTCDSNVPEILHNYFVNNSSIVIHIENPTKEERRDFFRPLFFGNNLLSVQKVLYDIHTNAVVKNIKKENENGRNTNKRRKRKRHINSTNRLRGGGRQRFYQKESLSRQTSDILSQKKHNSVNFGQDNLMKMNLSSKSSISMYCLHTTQKSDNFKSCNNDNVLNAERISAVFKDSYLLSSCSVSKHKLKENLLKNLNRNLTIQTRHSEPKLLYETKTTKLTKDQSVGTVSSFTTALSGLVDEYALEEKSRMCSQNTKNGDVERVHDKTVIKQKPLHSSTNYECNNFFGDSLTAETTVINNLYERVIEITTKDYSVNQLELLYDTISACIYINKNQFGNLLQKLNTTLSNFENNFL
ncbi:hypothetical protein ILUMI_00516 [Ignelater luminosus]|uniref:AAA+ ATPase domain-containing protein n=1 Tax=Ignelater luminosus TaxID=2038154 RepID=A0A8K0DH34_IGNLU|nr:hypothetical protein ILUMI_00516 [Ignelater luminosus]